MKIRNLLIAAMMVVFTIPAIAGGHLKNHDDPLKKTFISNPKQMPDAFFQDQLRKRQNWTKFLEKNGSWSVIFNESSGFPSLAYGKPISVGGADARSVGLNFITSNLNGFNVPVQNLVFKSSATSSKYHHANFTQTYQGLEVLFSRIQVTMTMNYLVNKFSMACYSDIAITVTPAISESSALSAAIANVPGVVSTSVSQDLKILPVPAYRKHNYHLVYEIIVNNNDNEGMPGRYYTLVDANNGEILYRSNQINYVAANTDVTVTGNYYMTHPYDPATTEPIVNMRMIVGSDTSYTDNTGYAGFSNTSPTTASASLNGRWVFVQTGGVVPTWTVNLNPGANQVDVDSDTDIKQRSAFRSVNTVHEYMKTKFPAFTGLDFPLEANLDVAGSCNAFYDGSSINFFDAGNDCNATSLVADVCYHEYGHGINDKFYQSIGESFDNGAMGEGYADIWALGITGAPILGIGFFSNDPNGFVRRYDIDKKVYPQDLVGEVHADGEIIAGAFWDTGLNLGNLQQMMDLFKETFYAGISGPDGTEGNLFPQVLIETLLADDNDGDLTNGTPNYCAITSGFAIHGISTSAAGGINHTQVLAAPGLSPISIDATITGLAPGNVVKGYYRVGNTGVYTMFPLNNVGGTSYSGTIPAQNHGTIVEYYMGIEDDCGTFLNIIPGGAADPNPNIPYYTLVGYNQIRIDDFDTFAGNWTLGVPSDAALTGLWTIDIPIPSYVGNGLVQPDIQNTPGGVFCAFTGNAANATAGAGDQDVDGGATTILSETYDLTAYTNPAFSYYRWYSNDQGATPGTDFWQVSITNDGTTYVPIENTNVADHSWRHFAFRVNDYVQPNSTVTIRFVAEDANDGSLVEAALDDIVLWDMIPVGLNENGSAIHVSLYPNPANNDLNISLALQSDESVTIKLVNNVGEIIFEKTENMMAGRNNVSLDTQNFANGIYQAMIITGKETRTRKFTILR